MQKLWKLDAVKNNTFTVLLQLLQIIGNNFIQGWKIIHENILQIMDRYKIQKLMCPFIIVIPWQPPKNSS